MFLCIQVMLSKLLKKVESIPSQVVAEVDSLLQSTDSTHSDLPSTLSQEEEEQQFADSIGHDSQSISPVPAGSQPALSPAPVTRLVIEHEEAQHAAEEQAESNGGQQQEKLEHPALSPILGTEHDAEMERGEMKSSPSVSSKVNRSAL
jgi:hypothetical protein